MRYILAGLAVAITVSAAATQATAQNTTRPFCIRDGAMGAGMWDCSYHTWAQCIASASGAGGTCQANPNYKGPKQKAKSSGSQWR